MAFLRTRRFWLGIVVIGGVIAFSGIMTLRVLAPQTSQVGVADCGAAEAGACLYFPQIRGLTFNGDPRLLPEDFSGGLNFVVIAFTEEQLLQAQAWLPSAQQLAAENPAFAYYSLSALPEIEPTVRLFVLAGLALLVPDEALREVSLLAYLDDMDAFLRALAIPDREAIVALLLDDAGEVLWRAVGAYSDAAAAELMEAVRGASNAPD